jgi:hypothetical protein
MSPQRICMWSGPRNVSTALMRSFGARPDTAVVDEPFYAAYLAATGLEHPLREAVLGSQPNDWRAVVAGLASQPSAAPLIYEKHMTHHMLPGFGRAWLGSCRSAFLIRDPARVLASYVKKRSAVSLQEIGLPQQRELFEQVSAELGAPAPVVDCEDLLQNPAGVLARLCEALDIPYLPAMLSWPAGPRASDGVRAPAWYDAVERSTGFAAPDLRAPELPDALRAIAHSARPHYEALAQHRLRA